MNVLLIPIIYMLIKFYLLVYLLIQQLLLAEFRNLLCICVCEGRHSKNFRLANHIVSVINIQFYHCNMKIVMIACKKMDASGFQLNFIHENRWHRITGESQINEVEPLPHILYKN